jgi:nitrite reductase (NADH) small subunit
MFWWEKIDMRQESAIGHVSQVPLGEGRNFAVNGLIITVFRTRAGEVFATEPRCPHKGGPLADGLLGGTTLVCPLHDTAFDLRTGEALAGGCRLRTYPVRQAEDGRIMLERVEASAL